MEARLHAFAENILDVEGVDEDDEDHRERTGEHDTHRPEQQREDHSRKDRDDRGNVHGFVLYIGRDGIVRPNSSPANWRPLARHVLHFLDATDEDCLERLQLRNASRTHDYQVTEEEFATFTSHFVPPAEAEGFTVRRVSPT
jgi:hypothetical protein